MLDQAREKILSTFGEEAAQYYDDHYDPDELIEFDGWNCDDWNEDGYCEGWDGISRRCCCGNRRVDWVWENGILYAEAY